MAFPPKAQPTGKGGFMPPVGKADSPGAAQALSQARSALSSFVKLEGDPQDKAAASQALKLLSSISS